VSRALAALLLAGFLSASAQASGLTLASLSIPGSPEFARTARDILDVLVSIDPSVASGGGLFDDSARAPSFSAASVAALTSRLDRDISALQAMPWRSWDIDRRIDWRWMLANAEEARRGLAVERMYLHRPAQWLEPFANNLIELVTYAPERTDLRAKLIGLLPSMTDEMRLVAVSPTARDVTTADGVAQGILALLESEPPGSARDAAKKALTGYLSDLKKLSGLPEYKVIGREDYAWRLEHALLLPWSASKLLALAQTELTQVDLELSAVPTSSTAARASTQEERLAQGLTQAGLLQMYDAVEADNRSFLDRSDVVTVPVGVGPIRARPTPEAMIPLTGDGGSMNPPPALGDSNVGWWNVEHFKPAWTQAERLEKVRAPLHFKELDMGPYSAHEGLPGHHLQLSIARLNPDPLRSLLQDNTMVEGWALYAEDLLWRAGGLGGSPEARRAVLSSWKFRVKRVFYDVNIEQGDWTLQDGADFKGPARRGTGVVDEDILRTINWPTQLIGYFTGKMQILELKEAYKRKVGSAYTERRFHDAFLAEGSIPVALIRAKLLGEPVPGM
jgi:hypothetical protein